MPWARGLREFQIQISSPADPVSNNRMGALNLDSNSTRACLHMPQGAMGSEVSTASLW